jgi:glycosyltransferase involved in cell wall biosynthesis
VEPLVSVVVPTRNSGRFLDRCLTSIRRQTYRALEVIVVDNNSTDQTLEIANSHADTVITAGPERSAQVNRGVEVATGEFVYRVDSDFELDEHVVEACVAAARSGADAVVVHNTPDAAAGWLARIRKFEVDMYKGSLDQSAARFVRRSVFQSMHGYDESITAGEDYDFQNRLNDSGYTTTFVDPEAIHLDEPTSLLPHLAKYYNYGQDFVRFRDKHPDTKQLTFFRPALVQNWRNFMRHPILGAGLIGYHTMKFAAGGTGYAVARMRLARQRLTSTAPPPSPPR